MNAPKDFLLLFGWDSSFELPPSDLISNDLIPARVICEERNFYLVQIGINESLWASVSGKMQFLAATRADYPAVGDWVMVERTDTSDRALIHHICPRKSMIHRKQAGLTAHMQILSTNVDYVFITTSANEDLNYRRIDRYLAVVREAGCIPVILVTKTDICSEKILTIVEGLQKEFPGVAVHPISKNDFESASFLAQYMSQGKTSVFVGSSGVGKSTLVRFLSGQEDIKMQDVRESDGKGRHTTTSRNMYVSRYGGLIIDTPGMRELQLTDHTEGLSAQFSDIEDLIKTCRFSDCRHQTEPVCGIKAAISDGTLSQDRWQNYQKLEAEVRHALRKQDKAIASEDRKAWKKLTLEGKIRGRAKKKPV